MEYLKLIELTGRIVAKLLGLKKDRKLEVAGYLENIAETLAQFPSRVRAGAPYEELAGLSKQAADYAVRFRDATGDVISSSDAESFVILLEQAHDAKAALLNEKPGARDERLRIISEIAGSVRVAAATLRGTASRLRNPGHKSA
jgi:hypothetical protein